MLQKFATYKGFIFLPRGYDTCPRTVIEAKLLNCQLITNDYVQHKNESWFNGSSEDAMLYLRSRTKLFWDKEFCNVNLPTDCKIEEKTHFKIVVPSYNAQNCRKLIEYLNLNTLDLILIIRLN